MDIQTNSKMQDCIEACLHCYQVCQQTAMTHCLEMGGKHVAPDHMRLMLGCAEICRTSAHFMLTNVAMHAVVCAACAEVCRACADDCRNVGDMDECVEACERCAQHCEEMGQGSGGMNLGTPRNKPGAEPGQLAM